MAFVLRHSRRRIDIVLLLLFFSSASGCGKPVNVPSTSPSPSTANEPTHASTVPVPDKTKSDQPLHSANATSSTALELEKTALKFGFIKLTDCAPLVIAKEKGFFGKKQVQKKQVPSTFIS